jgi:hypothetical protein
MCLRANTGVAQRILDPEAAFLPAFELQPHLIEKPIVVHP